MDKEDKQSLYNLSYLIGLSFLSMTSGIFIGYNNKPVLIEVRDINKDGRNDVIVMRDRFFGFRYKERTIFLQQPNGTYITSDSFIQMQKDSIEARLK